MWAKAGSEVHSSDQGQGSDSGLSDYMGYMAGAAMKRRRDGLRREVLKVHQFQGPRNLILTSTEHHHCTEYKLKYSGFQWWPGVDISRQTDGIIGFRKSLGLSNS